MTFDQPHSTTNSVPPEILSLFFQHACHFDFEDHFPEPSYNHRTPTIPKSRTHTPTILGSVCAKWRDVVLSTPQLWTRLAMEINDINLDASISLFRLHLQNSRNHLMSIELDFVKERDRIEGSSSSSRRISRFEANLKPLEDLIFQEYPDRFQEFRAVYPPLKWSVKDKYIPRLSKLDTILLAWPEMAQTSSPQSLVHFRLSFPSLQQLSISLPDPVYDPPTPPLLDLRWGLITMLDLSFVQYSECIRAFKSCRNLRSVRVFYAVVFGDSQSYPVFESKDLVYDHLEHFSWAFPRSYHHNISQFNKDLLRNIQLPSVKSVSLPEIFESRVPFASEAIPIFLSNLPDSCDTLSITCPMEFDFPGIENVERCLGYGSRSVKRILLEGCCDTLMKVLFPPRRTTKQEVSNLNSNSNTELVWYPFPFLIYLECRHIEPHVNWLRSSIGQFDWECLVDVVRMKKKVGLTKEFCLHLFGNRWSDVVSEVEIKEAVEEFNRDGFKFEVIQTDFVSPRSAVREVEPRRPRFVRSMG